MKERDYGMDNLKWILIICVVFGHVIEEISKEGLFGVLRAFIYSFHMPVFAFISGYFSKNMGKGYQHAVKNYLIPYLIFNTIWTMLDKHTVFIDILLPIYVFWYMLSLFLWKILTPALIRIRGIFLLSILLALYIGIFNEADRFLSISRTICFMPFFILGVLCKRSQIEKIRQIPHYICGIVFSIVSIFVVYCQMNSILSLKMYENIQSYKNVSFLYRRECFNVR